ncbi:MAG: hypothetical protein M1826_006039 [Phylliscum demangeonii]|nr:MAG: hypothetical protein M1826_006039 [Phylliscum demangeonii]
MLEPLPAYSPRSPSHPDLETASLHSAAPSYRSAAPSYHSSLPSAAGSGRGESASTARARVRPLPSLTELPIPSWSNVQASHQAKHYHSVARRRALATAEAAMLARNQASMGSAANGKACQSLPPAGAPSALLLEEDPFIVGGEAAVQARLARQRQCQQAAIAEDDEEDALVAEDKAWDFMLGQMADWDERERSWARFRKEADKTSRWRRKIGVLGTGKW